MCQVVWQSKLLRLLQATSVLTLSLETYEPHMREKAEIDGCGIQSSCRDLLALGEVRIKKSRRGAVALPTMDANGVRVQPRTIHIASSPTLEELHAYSHQICYPEQAPPLVYATY